MDSFAADIVMLNGNVITVNKIFDIREAVATKDNTILTVGSNEEVRKLIGNTTKVIDLRGRSVLPGFEDSHAHFIQTATQYGGLYLGPETTPSMDVLLRKVRERVKEKARGYWIVGGGWDETKMEWREKWDREHRFPTKEDLDSVAPENPVYLFRICGRVAAFNSAALWLAGINKDTPQPIGGKIDAYENGDLTGIMRDLPAMRMVGGRIVTDAFWPSSYDEFKRGVGIAISHGITCVEEAGLLGRRGLDFYRSVLKDDEVPIRVNILLDPELLEDAISEGIKSPHTIYDSKLRICGVKFFCDGLLSERGAALKEPYSDKPDTRGFFRSDLEWLTDKFTKAHRQGLQCCTHAIGDLANEVVLKANKTSYEEIKEEPGRYRDRIEHCDMLPPEIIDAYKDQRMIASIQFSFASSYARWVKYRVGPERIKWTFPWRKLMEKEIRCCGGTDTPMDTFIPLEGIQRIVTSVDEVDSCLTIKEAIRLYTIDSAYAQWQEDCLGSIEEGKLADLIVLSGDILNTPPGKISELKLEMTMIGGEIVYTRQ